MKKLVVIGTENSHASIFSGIYNALLPNGKRVYPDLEVYGAFGDEVSTQKLLDLKGVKEVAKNFDDFVDIADGCLVTARKGSLHLKYAKPYIEKGIPVFIDKPFTSSVKDAKELCELLKKYNAPYIGGSGVKHAKQVKDVKARVKELQDAGLFKSAVLSFDVQLDSENDGFYFYATHLIEMMIEIFGYGAKDVFAERNKDSATALVNFGDFSVTLQFTDKVGHYESLLFYQGGIEYKEINIDDIFQAEAKNYAEVVATGVSPQTYEQMIYPIIVAEAIEKSMKTGKVVEIKE